MNISSHLTPPLKMSLPYFGIAVLAYFIFAIFLFKLSTEITLLNFNMAALIHLYLLGFVMMVLFGSYAQLLPVLFEKRHAKIFVYYLIWPLHILALLLLLISFIFDIRLIALSAFFSLLAISIFIIEALLTIKGQHNRSNITKAISLAFIFLTIGIISASVMAMSFFDFIEIDFTLWLKVHIISIIFGFVYLSLITFAMVLIPMFSLPRNYTQHPYNVALYTLLTALLLFYLAPLLKLHSLEIASYIFIVISLSAFSLQLFNFHLCRVRVEHDIYAKTLYISFISLVLSIVFTLLFYFFAHTEFLHAGVWFFGIGFLASFITANLYKIVPFLIWQKRFAPLIEEQPVPMLYEMISQKLASAQWFFSSLGIFTIGVGLLLSLELLLFYGSYLFLIGKVCLAFGFKHMLTIKTN